MGEIRVDPLNRAAIDCEGGNARTGVAHRLSLAAAPTFAFMALLTAALDAGAPDLLCSARQHASPVTGMVGMYLLMSAFHAAPWLKLFSRRRQ